MSHGQPGTISNGDEELLWEWEWTRGGGDTGVRGHVRGCAGVEVPVGGTRWRGGGADAVQRGVEGAVVPALRRARVGEVGRRG